MGPFAGDRHGPEPARKMDSENRRAETDVRVTIETATSPVCVQSRTTIAHRWWIERLRLVHLSSTEKKWEVPAGSVAFLKVASLNWMESCRRWFADAVRSGDPRMTFG